MTQQHVAAPAELTQPVPPDTPLGRALAAPALERSHANGLLLGRLVSVLAVVAVGAFIVILARNDAMDWPTFAEYLVNERILAGLRMTLGLTAAVTVASFALGTVIAAMRLSAVRGISAIAWGYVSVFRTIPLLVQLLLWFNIGYLFPTLGVALPFTDLSWSVNTNNLISATTAAFIGLTLHETAYAAEVIRGGILSVDRGQHEAAHAVGLSKTRTLFAVVLPNAMRSIIPAGMGLLIGTLKHTAVVSYLAVSDLLYSVQLIYNANYQVIPLLMVAVFWYAVCTSVLSVLQHVLERHFIKRYTRGS
ncbi:amino acid ABC transporter permease [Georgenia sunbinii]|uniref:amino acid ABC transporter permease n=1 Tax=Georgenia sunbinii TaxID=3117728 RepID=UPI002F2664C2